jgi:hypothetical protein
MTIGRLTRQTGVAVVLAMLLLTALALGKMVYFMAQEALVVTLLLAIVVAVGLLLLIALVLFQAGIRRAALWTTGIGRLAKLSHGQMSPPRRIGPRPSRH